MHLRQFIMTGLLVGAALFLPNDAFAEKNDVSDKQNSHKPLVSSKVPEKKVALPPQAQEKVESAKPLENVKKKPDPVIKNENKVKQEPPKSTAAQAIPPKAAAVLKKLPEKAKGKVQAALKKTEKIVQTSWNAKASTAKPEKVEHNPSPKMDVEHSALHSLVFKGKEQVDSPGLIHESQPEQNDLNFSTKEKGSLDPIRTKPPMKEKVPTSKKEIPEADQVTNPTQRTNHSSGGSNDRVSHGGFSSISFWDKWFEWNKFYENQLIQPFLSRHAFMNNQWVNAPPSPPPQEALLLKMVNRS